MRADASAHCSFAEKEIKKQSCERKKTFIFIFNGITHTYTYDGGGGGNSETQQEAHSNASFSL